MWVHWMFLVVVDYFRQSQSRRLTDGLLVTWLDQKGNPYKGGSNLAQQSVE